MIRQVSTKILSMRNGPQEENESNDRMVQGGVSRLEAMDSNLLGAG